MKGSSNIFRFFLVVALLQVSCMSSKYFQICETTIDAEIVSLEGEVLFETEELVFSYNLWSSKGDAGFKVSNISDSDVTIDLTKTFYVRNGLARPYFSDGEISYSAGAGATVAVKNQYYNSFFNQSNLAAASSASSTTKTYRNPREIVIPANTHIDVGGFSVTNGYINECDLQPYPSLKETTSFVYDKENTPVLFSNIVSYESEGETHRVEHEFYISRVTNLPESKALESVYLDDCGKKLYVPKKVFSVVKPSSFYYEYVKKL